MNLDLLERVESYVVEFIIKHVPKKYCFHDVPHTVNVVDAVQELAQLMELDASEQEMLMIAAWFHDLGYNEGGEDHEERGAALAEEFLTTLHYPVSKIEIVKSCILATKIEAVPTTVLEQILCDADLSHLGQFKYWDRCTRIRKELKDVKDIEMEEKEWLEFELGFLNSHRFYTSAAQQLYEDKKQKHIQLLKSKLAALAT